MPLPPLVRRALVTALAVALLVPVALPGRVAAATTWSRNLWSPGTVMFQDPYPACVAASTMTMLNMVAARGTGGPGFRWSRSLVQHNAADPADYRDMTSVYGFAARYDTLAPGIRGSDPHGWRNALNHYGWGATAMREPAVRVYDDLAFTSLDAALHAAVRAIARYQMPVGLLQWAGGHAQVMHGYRVTGADPAVSDAFTVEAVIVSDTLRWTRLGNTAVPYAMLRAGDGRVRFQRYREIDSPVDDAFSPGFRRSSVAPTVGPSEWYGKWVIVAPVRGFRAAATAVPAPTASPTPAPAAAPVPTASAVPAPSATPSPEPSAEPTPSPEPSATPEPSPEPTVEPTPGSSPEPSAEPSPEPSADPTPEPSPDPGDEPTPEPSLEPSPEPTAEPSASAGPVPDPTAEPSAEPVTAVVSGTAGRLAL